MGKQTKVAMLVCLAVLFTLYLLGLEAGKNNVDNSEPVNDRENVRIGFSMVESQSPWSISLNDSISEAVMISGYELVYEEPEEYTSEWQLESIREMLYDGQVDYLIYFPREDSIIPQILELAKEKEIPVILFAANSYRQELEDGTLYDYRDNCSVTIFIDYTKQGRLCAKELAEIYGDEECRIIEIRGPLDSSVTMARMDGFHQELRKYPNMKVVESIDGSDDRVYSQLQMSELISNLGVGSFQAIFSCSDEDGLGAQQALKVAGYNPGQDISIVSVGGTQDALKAIFCGEYNATIESGKNMGETAIEYVKRLESGYDKSRFVVIPYRIFNQNTSEYWLTNALYY